MARRHTGGFDVLGFDSDPTPGDPDRLLGEAVTHYETLGDDAAAAAEALVGSEVASGTGEAMESLRDVIGTEYAGKLRTTAESFRGAAQIYRRYATTLADAQADLDRAMDQALPVAGTANAVVPDVGVDPTPEQVQAADERQDEIDDARSVLDGASRLAEDAAALRERAGQQFASDLDDTGTVPERGFFEKVGDFFANNPLVQLIIDAVIAVVSVFAPVVGLVLALAAFAVFTATSIASGNFDAASFVLGILGVVAGGAGFLGKLPKTFTDAVKGAGATAGSFFSEATGAISKGLSDITATVAKVGRGTGSIVDDAAGGAASVSDDIPLLPLPGGGSRPGSPDVPPPATPATPPPPKVDVDETFTGFLGGNAQKINEFLRDPTKVPAADRPLLDAQAAAVSAKLDSLPDLGEITVFRGVNGNFAEGLKRGDVFKDPAFLSTTLDKDKARDFGLSGGGINFKEDIGEITTFSIQATGGKDVSSLTGLNESEVLFDRGTEFIVEGRPIIDEIPIAGRDPVKVNKVNLRSPDVETD